MTGDRPDADRSGFCDDQGGLGLENLGFLLGAAHRARRKQWEENLADLGLSAPQAALLRLIAAEPGCGVRQLARRLGTDPMNAQRIGESLIANGLCESKRDPSDARRRPLYPTRLGLDVAASVRERAESDELSLARALGESRYRSLIAALNAIISLESGT